MDEYIGKQLGAYQVVEQVGQGGMATIFKAYQPSVDRYVAVKVLPRHFTEDESFVARFTQEAHTLARLEHPHILPIHDYGEQEGLTYLVMRYVEAGTLKDLIAQRGSLKPHEAMRILGQVGRALGYAHSQGIIHRDIKPSNVLIDERGDAFLMDFGIAKLVAGSARFTATGAVVGTPAYMSPEQGRGEQLDHRCDIYALGVVLYEMVTGRVPFEAETPLAVLFKHISDPLPPPRRVKPDLPEAVERVILKALAKSPDDRFQTAEEMVAALQKAVAGISTEIIPPKPKPEPEPEPVAETVVAKVGAAEAPPLATCHSLRRSADSQTPPGPTLRMGTSDVTPPTDAVRRPKPVPWLLVAGGVAVLAVMLIAGLLILPRLGGGRAEATPTVVEASLPPGWTNYSNGNFVRALTRQGDHLWAGGGGGLVRWDPSTGDYVKFGFADGLASNQVNDVLVEGEILWVATERGLNRFDGHSWQTFDELDGLDSNEVECLFLDDDGGLWAGTDGERGLNYYPPDRSAWGPPPIPPLPVESPVVHLLVVEEDYILAGLAWEGLARFDFDRSEWEVFTPEEGLPGDYVHDVLIDNDEVLWASFYDVVARYNSDSDEWEPIPQLEDRNMYALHQADDGSFWFGGDGLIRYDPAAGDWQGFELGVGAIPDEGVTTIVEDEDGLWLGTDGGGVVGYDGTSWQAWVTGDEVGGNGIEDILQDGIGGAISGASGGGAVWLTHPGSGLSRYNPIDDTWQVFGEDEGAVDWPYHPGVDGGGQVWIGGYEELRWYEGSRWQRFGPEQLEGAGTIYQVAFAPDGVGWFLGEDELIRHDPVGDEWITFTAEEHPALGEMEWLYLASDGTAWVDAAGGLVYYDPDEGSWHRLEAEGDGPEYIYRIAEGPDGSLWVTAGSLYQLEGDEWQRFEWPDGYAVALTVGPDGVVWVGSDDGVGRYDPASGTWQQTLTTADGLINDDVNVIYVTPEGVVWIGTAGGVSRYVPGE